MHISLGVCVCLWSCLISRRKKMYLLNNEIKLAIRFESKRKKKEIKKRKSEYET